MNNRDQLVLESKADMVKRGVVSPNFGDALPLTWAAPVPPVETAAEDESQRWGSH